MNWARLIKRLRKKHFLKQEALADMIGVQQSSISRWENGLSIPGQRARKAFQDILANARLNSSTDNVLKHQVRCSENMVLIDRSSIFQGASLKFCRAYKRPVEDIVGKRHNEKMLDDGESLYLLDKHLRKDNIVFAKLLNGGWDEKGNLLYTISDITPTVTSKGDMLLLLTSQFISKETFNSNKRQYNGQLKLWTLDELDSLA